MKIQFIPVSKYSLYPKKKKKKQFYNKCVKGNPASRMSTARPWLIIRFKYIVKSRTEITGHWFQKSVFPLIFPLAEHKKMFLGQNLVPEKPDTCCNQCLVVYHAIYKTEEGELLSPSEQIMFICFS